jgi:polysaccharide biosynthesis protein PslE
MTLQQLVDLYNYVRQALGRHWKLAAIAFAAGCFLALVGTLLMPRSYYSEARLFVRFGRENRIDPTADGGQMVAVSETRESEINSLIEIFKSRAILDRVVEELGPQYILSGRAKTVPAKASAAGAQVTQPQPSQPPSYAHQQAVLQLEREVSVWSPRKTNTINVSCKAKSPAIAQQLVAKLVEVFLAEHVRVHHTAGSYEFFVAQTGVSQKSWQAAAARFRDVKNKLGIVTIEGKRKELEGQIGDIANKLLTNEADLRTAEAKIASLKKLIEQLPATIVTQKVDGPNAAFDGMRQTLYQAEAREQEMASKMQDNHPQLIAIRQQVVDLRAILADQPIQRLLATEAANPTRQAMDLALANEQSSADSLRGRGRELLALRDKLQGELRKLNAHEGEVNQLQQAVELAEARHKDYAQKLEQARINRSLDEDRISSLNIVQPASYVAKSTGPRRLYVLVLGLMFAALSSIGAALAAAYLNPVFITMNDLNQLLDLPLVGTLPRDVFQPTARA